MVTKKLWAEDPQVIFELFNKLISSGLLITLQLRKKKPLRSKLLKIHYFKHWPYLLIMRPLGLESTSAILSLFFKMSGLPIIGFPCPIERESQNILAVKLPSTLFQLELRDTPRILSPTGSMATFFIKDRARVNICMLDNISLSGAKLIGKPTHFLKIGNQIGPCTFSFAEKKAKISREVTINDSLVIRIEETKGEGVSSQLGLALQFNLTQVELEQLKEHIKYTYHSHINSKNTLTKGG